MIPVKLLTCLVISRVSVSVSVQCLNIVSNISAAFTPDDQSLYIANSDESVGYVYILHI
jgi:hypothetical protein